MSSTTQTKQETGSNTTQSRDACTLLILSSLLTDENQRPSVSCATWN